MEKHFYCVHDWMTNELGLRGSERDVFAVIFSFSESCGVFTGGLKYLCQRTGTTKPTVMGCLGKLLKKDLLIKKIYDWISREYENGRVTVISEREMEDRHAEYYSA